MLLGVRVRRSVAAPEVRIKDIASLRGLRANQVLGIGLVTGLAGKGDSPSSALLRSTLASLVSTFGVDVSPQDVRSKNCAVVMVSAELPALLAIGDRIDVTVSSIGDARDLDGGVLLQATLLAANGKTYAVAQGRVVSTPDTSGVRTVGQLSAAAPSWSRRSSPFVADDVVSIVLRNPDFVTATPCSARSTRRSPASCREPRPIPDRGADPEGPGAADPVALHRRSWRR